MNDLKKNIVVAIVAGLLSGIVTVLGFGLVGNNQPVQTIIEKGGEIFGGVGTNFPNGLFTDYLTFPPRDADSALGLKTYATTRRCQIASGSDTCSLTNFSSVNWLIKPTIFVTGAATNTFANFFVATSTAALSGSWWNGSATSSQAHTPMSVLYSTTTAPFANFEMLFGTTSSALNAYPQGTFVLREGELVNCAVYVKDLAIGERGLLYEGATSTNFTQRGNCVFDIIATSSPDTTPAR